MDSDIKQIFKQSSTSYYYSSLFFPEDVKEDVFRLYAYVRTADDFVDDIPQDEKAFYSFRDKTSKAINGEKTGDKVVDGFVSVMKKKEIEEKWVEAFLDSMEADLEKSYYETIDETLEYIYGSAEVIGLMMAKILDLDEEAMHEARMLGRSMQYCNFIRDIKEDNGLGRQYLPQEELEKHGLKSLEEEHVKQHRNSFKEFMRSQIDQYWKWEKEAQKGFKYIPYRYRVPVMLSADIYEWTAQEIREDPFIVYRKEVRPSKIRIGGKLVKSLRG